MAPACGFIRKLRYMLSDVDDDCICWFGDGDGVCIVSVSALETATLPKYFKHDRYLSFCKQLTNYGFRRDGGVGVGSIVYRHPFFSRYKPEQDVLVQKLQRHKLIFKDPESELVKEVLSSRKRIRLLEGTVKAYEDKIARLEMQTTLPTKSTLWQVVYDDPDVDVPGALNTEQ